MENREGRVTDKEFWLALLKVVVFLVVFKLSPMFLISMLLVFLGEKLDKLVKILEHVEEE